MSQFTDESLYDPPHPGNYYFCLEKNGGVSTNGFTLLMKWVMMVRFSPELYKEIKKVDHGEINKQNGKGYTALHLACINLDHGSSARVVKLLLKMGANPNLRNSSNNNPIMSVCNRLKSDDEFRVAKILIKHGSIVDFVNKQQANLLSVLLYDLNVDGIKESDFIKLLKSIKTDEKRALQLNSIGTNALYYACKYAPYYVFEHVFSRITEITKRRLREHRLFFENSYLHVACMNGSSDGYKIVRTLLESGFDIRAVDSRGKIPYFYATIFGFNEKLNSGWRNVMESLRPANHPECSYRDSLLMYSIFQHGHRVKVEHMKELLDKGGSFNVNHQGNKFILQFLVCCKDDSIENQVLEFVIDNGVDIDHTDSCGDTALILASRYGFFNQVAFLLGKNADVNRVNKKNESALLWAIRKKHFRIAELLLQHGAKIGEASEANEIWGELDEPMRRLIESYKPLKN